MSFKGKKHKEIWEQVHASKNPTRTTRKQREKIIAVLNNAEKPLSQKEIAERARVPLPVVCRVVKHLLKEFYVIRLGYKHEPRNPYRYVMNNGRALDILKQYYKCPICGGNNLYHLYHNVSCESCNELIIVYCLQVIDPDDVSTLLTKLERESYAQSSPVSKSEPNHTIQITEQSEQASPK